MKIYLTIDNSYYHYKLTKKVEGIEIELTFEDYLEYKNVVENYMLWQEKLDRLGKK